MKLQEIVGAGVFSAESCSFFLLRVTGDRQRGRFQELGYLMKCEKHFKDTGKFPI